MLFLTKKRISSKKTGENGAIDIPGKKRSQSRLRLTEPLASVATHCLLLKLFHYAAYAAAQTECFRQPPRSFARFSPDD